MIKGSKASAETRLKMSLVRRGIKKSPETRRKMGFWQLGKKHSAERIEKNRLGHLGIKPSAETLKKMSLALKGKTAGAKHYNWKGGITTEIVKLRNSKEYGLWRKSVFERDNYTCRFCCKKGGFLHADHIKPFAYFPELRFAIDNGRTLCIECHKSTDTYGYKATRYAK